MNSDSAIATTRSGAGWIDNDDIFHFDATIYLNPYYMATATKEEKISTILHESIHAYIRFVFSQYVRHEIDSAQVKAKFPVHWEYFMGRAPSESQQHIIMVEKYIDAIAKQVKKYWNPAATATQRNIGAEALVWGGLYKDAGWTGLSTNNYITDTCKIRAIIGQDKMRMPVWGIIIHYHVALYLFHILIPFV